MREFYETEIDMNHGVNGKTTLFERIVFGTFFTAGYAIILFFISKYAIWHHLYKEPLFYLCILVVIIWWILMITFYVKLCFCPKIKKGLSQVVFITLFIAGAFTSFILGKASGFNGGPFVWIYFIVLIFLI